MGEWRRGGEEEWRRWFECPDLAWADCVVAVSVRGELEGDVTWSRPGTLQSGQATPGHTAVQPPSQSVPGSEAGWSHHHQYHHHQYHHTPVTPLVPTR